MRISQLQTLNLKLKPETRNPKLKIRNIESDTRVTSDEG